MSTPHDVSFIRILRLGTFDCGVLSDYFPKNKFPDPPEEHRRMREFIWNFKDGYHGDDVAQFVVSSINNHFANLKQVFPNPIFAIIPASTQEKTNMRFLKMANKVCEMLKWANGYNAIKVSVAHDATKGNRNKDVLQYLAFDAKLFKDKDVILFDDVKTTGKSFIQCANRLKVLGARKVFGIFLGETYSTFNKGLPDWMIEDTI